MQKIGIFSYILYNPRYAKFSKLTFSSGWIWSEWHSEILDGHQNQRAVLRVSLLLVQILRWAGQGRNICCTLYNVTSNNMKIIYRSSSPVLISYPKRVLQFWRLHCGPLKSTSRKPNNEDILDCLRLVVWVFFLKSKCLIVNMCRTRGESQGTCNIYASDKGKYI